MANSKISPTAAFAIASVLVVVIIILVACAVNYILHQRNNDSTKHTSTDHEMMAGQRLKPKRKRVTFSDIELTANAHQPEYYNEEDEDEDERTELPAHLLCINNSDFKMRYILYSDGIYTYFFADAIKPSLKLSASASGGVIMVKQFNQPYYITTTTAAASAKKQMEMEQNEMFDRDVRIMEYFKGDPCFTQILGYSISPTTEQTDKCKVILMNYYSLGTLKTFFTPNIMENKMRKNRKVYILAFLHDIACAIGHLHENEFVHLRIRADSIFIDQTIDGHPFCVLSDFASCLHLHTSITSNSSLLLSSQDWLDVEGLGYVAPERFCIIRDGNIRSETVMSWDIYSFAVVIYTLLTDSHR